MSTRKDWNDLSDSLDRLLPMDTAAREVWLQGLAATNLRVAEELRRLLELDSAMREKRFLEGASPLEQAQLEGHMTLIGTRVGAWTIEAEAGRGGMGTVWRARRNDGRYEGQAAIKFVHLSQLGNDGEQRFRREGLLLGRLDHTNIARLLDAGMFGPTNQPYLVLEYVDGQQLDSWCDARTLGVRERVTLFTNVLQAVAHAHSHLVIHRDLKPSNILVTSSGEVKLLDFGIAKLADDNAEHNQTRTRASVMTPQYAAPEQLRGTMVSTRTDIYSLGLVLYRLLTGRHAFDSSDTTKRSRRPEDSAPALAATENGRPFIERAQLLGDLENIVAKALRSNPAERYSTAGAFMEDLERFLRNEPVTACPDTVTYRARKFVRRHLGGVTAVLLVAISLIGAIIFTTQQMLEARRQQLAAAFEARRAEASADFLQLVLSENRPANRALTTDELLTRAATLLKQQYGDDPAFMSTMLLSLASEQASRRNYASAAELLVSATANARKSRNKELEAQALCQHSFMESGRTEMQVAQSLLTQARAVLATSAKRGWEVDVQCLRAEANLAERTFAAGANDNQLISLLQGARARIESADATHRRAYTSVLSHLAVAYRSSGDIQQAMDLVRLGGRIHESNGRGQTRSRMIALGNEAVLLSVMGEFKASFEAHDRVWKQLAALETESAQAAYFAMNYVLAAHRLGGAVLTQAATLLPSIENGAREREDFLTELDAATLRARVLIDADGPREDIDELVERLQALLNETDKTIPNSYRHAVVSLLANRDLQKNDIVSARQRIDSLIAELGASPNEMALRYPLLSSAATALAAGDYERAITEATRVASIAVKAARGPDTSGLVGDALLVVGKAQARSGQLAEARITLQRAQRCLISGYGADHEYSLEARRLLAELAA
jgi:eukaryotic-like serine/threonine-protein kinase